jgi:hypothetical protein
VSVGLVMGWVIAFFWHSHFPNRFRDECVIAYKGKTGRFCILGLNDGPSAL